MIDIAICKLHVQCSSLDSVIMCKIFKNFSVTVVNKIFFFSPVQYCAQRKHPESVHGGPVPLSPLSWVCLVQFGIREHSRSS